MSRSLEEQLGAFSLQRQNSSSDSSVDSNAARVNNPPRRAYVAACAVCCLDDGDDERSYQARQRWRPGSWISIEAIVDSAAKGCFNCGTISNGTLNYLQRFEKSFSKIQARITYVNRHPLKQVPLMVLVRFRSGHTKRDLTLEFWDTQGSKSFSAYGSSSSSGYSSNDVSYEKAASLLRHCKTSHPLCYRGSIQSSRLPRRLLKILRVENSLEFALIDTFREAGMDLPHYVALSHCWGEVQPLRLLHDNLATMVKGLPLQYLPVLFRDVTDLALYLGFSFLWIDALCIIQDDESDWEIESAKMGDIYQNATVTIAAGSPPDSRFSLLASKNQQNFAPTGDKSSIIVRCRKLSSDALHTRGWTYQEYMLGHRVIDLGAETVTLHCASGTIDSVELLRSYPKAEEIKSATRMMELMGEPYGFRYVWTNNFCLKSSATSRLPVPNIIVWARIVNMYAFRKLTRRTDRLPALSGMASFYQRHAAPDDEYLAGLWRNDFAFCLGWGVDDYRGTIPPSYRAPSWSWVSIDAVIKYPTELTRNWISNIVVRDVCCKMKGINPFGEVADGFAVVTGPTIELNLHATPGRSKFEEDEYLLWLPDQEASVSFTPDVRLAPEEAFTETGITRTLRRAHPSRDSTSPNGQYKVLALHLSTGVKENGDHDFNNEAFLILGLDSHESAVYQRLGLRRVFPVSPEWGLLRYWISRAKQKTIKIV